jgi:hypothetical protein
MSSQRCDNGGESGGTDKEDEQSDENPSHATHSSPFDGFHWTGCRADRQVVSEAYGFGILGDTFPQSESTIPAEPQL